MKTPHSGSGKDGAGNVVYFIDVMRGGVPQVRTPQEAVVANVMVAGLLAAAAGAAALLRGHAGRC